MSKHDQGIGELLDRIETEEATRRATENEKGKLREALQSIGAIASYRGPPISRASHGSVARGRPRHPLRGEMEDGGRQFFFAWTTLWFESLHPVRCVPGLVQRIEDFEPDDAVHQIVRRLYLKELRAPESHDPNAIVPELVDIRRRTGIGSVRVHGYFSDLLRHLRSSPGGGPARSTVRNLPASDQSEGADMQGPEFEALRNRLHNHPSLGGLEAMLIKLQACDEDWIPQASLREQFDLPPTTVDKACLSGGTRATDRKDKPARYRREFLVQYVVHQYTPRRPARSVRSTRSSVRSDAQA